MPSLTGVQTCARSEEHTSELQSLTNLVCRLLLEKRAYSSTGYYPKKMVAVNRKKLHEIFEVSRSSLYYKSKKYKEDLKVKEKIEKAWNDHPSYGHKRLAIELKLNKRGVLRVMKKFNLKPYRRHRRPFKRSIVSIYDKYPNLLPTTLLTRINQIWATDFTYIWYKNRFIYVATVIDIYNREVVGVCVLSNHSSSLVIQAMAGALMDHHDQISFTQIKVVNIQVKYILSFVF